MFSRPKILFLVSLLFVALLNPKFNPYLLFKFLIFYHSSIYIYIYVYIYIPVVFFLIATLMVSVDDNQLVISIFS